MKSCNYIKTIDYPNHFKMLDWPVILADPNLYLQAVLDFKNYHHLNQISLPLHDQPFYRALGLGVDYDWDLGIKIQPAQTNQIPKAFNHDIILVYQELIGSLKSMNIPVTFEVSGIFSVASNWIELDKLILLTRKNPDQYGKIMAQTCSLIVDWLFLMAQAGVSDFYYADAVGGVDIVGPRFYGQHLGPWTYRLLKARKEKLAILLCPRSFFSLKILDLFEENHQGLYHQSLCSSESLQRPRLGAFNLKERCDYYD